MDNAPDLLQDVHFEPLSDHDSSDEEEWNMIMNSSSSSDSSSSSSESDLEEIVHQDIERGDRDIIFPLLQMIMFGRRRPKVEDYLNTVHEKSNEQFRRDFRLTRETAYNLIDQLHASGFIPLHDIGRPKASAELSFLLFLRFVGNEDPHRIGELFDVSESSVFRIRRRVVDWLITLVPQYIVWPRGNEARRVQDRFAEMHNIQGCMGAVDGSHIRIIKPSVEDPRVFVNRKGYFSINLTAIADADNRFLMVNCGQPGIRHDVRVFRESDFYIAVERNRFDYFPAGTFIIGDAAYQGLNPSWIVYPFRDNGHLTPNQRNFNTIISSMRVVTEQAFGILKGRFRRLLHQISLFDIPFMVDITVACCVLHNICLDVGDDGEDFYDDVGGDDAEDDNAVDNDNVNGNIDNGVDGMDARARIFRQLFQNN